MVAELIGKYIWLVRIISASGDQGLTLEELSEKYEERWDQEYSRRTFNNHRLAVEEVFGIEIKCNRSSNRYYIPFSDDALDDDASVRWLVNTFTVNNLLTLGKERLSGRVSVEEVPSGQKYLTGIMQAMEENREVEIEYSKYKASSSETLHVQPFAVKEHERRWYLVGFCRERAEASGERGVRNSDRRFWRVYGLDRIVSLKETDESFKIPKDFDVDELFYRSYGIYFPKEGQKAHTIRFRTTAGEAKYIRDLPLHRSQKEEKPDGGLPVFTIRVIPNENLIMEFCRHGDRLEVLEPEEVRSAVAAELERAVRLYDND